MLTKNVFFLFVFSVCFCSPNLLASQINSSSTITLAHTDGATLLTKKALLAQTTKAKLVNAIDKACNVDCVNPFGKLLGQVDGVKSYSNCKSTCVAAEYSFLNLFTKEVTIHRNNPNPELFHYIGLTHQCVQFARKWWMMNKGITFGSIDSAYEIIYLTEGKQLRSDATFALARSINGSANRPPKRGDLLIYSPDLSRVNWRHGHVAVVVEVDLSAGTIAIAEENYNNQVWDQPKSYSRKIKITKTADGYLITDEDKNHEKNKSLGIISGWLYPLSENSNLPRPKRG